MVMGSNSREALIERIAALTKELAEARAVIAGDPPAEVADYLRGHKEADQKKLDLIEKQANRLTLATKVIGSITIEQEWSSWAQKNIDTYDLDGDALDDWRKDEA
jgi:hypothetical protein